MAMGESNLEVTIAEIRANTEFIKRDMAETKTEVKAASASIIGLQHQMQDVKQLRSEIDKMRDEHKREIDEIRTKLTKLMAYAAIVAVIASALISGIASGIGRNLVSKEEVAAAAPTKKAP